MRAFTSCACLFLGWVARSRGLVSIQAYSSRRQFAWSLGIARGRTLRTLCQYLASENSRSAFLKKYRSAFVPKTSRTQPSCRECEASHILTHCRATRSRRSWNAAAEWCTYARRCSPKPARRAAYRSANPARASCTSMRNPFPYRTQMLLRRKTTRPIEPREQNIGICQLDVYADNPLRSL